MRKLGRKFEPESELPGTESYMSSEVLRLGILADNSNELRQLIGQLAETPHKVDCSALISASEQSLRDDVDAWIVRIAEHSDAVDVVLDWLYDHDLPVVIQDAGSERKSAQFLTLKISEAVAAYRDISKRASVPERVWVIAASAGGPEAVGVFLEALGNRASNSAFIYAQHIDTPVLPALMAGVKARGSFTVKYCEHGDSIDAGCLYIVSPAEAFEISEAHRFVIRGSEWLGLYQPSINQVIAKVARTYRDRCGAIVFTGMGDDGAESSPMMNALGGKVLIQDFDSCTVDSMPRCVDESTEVFYCGEPVALAHKVAELSRMAGTGKALTE